MTELSESYRAMKKESQAKRAGNRSASSSYLENHDIPFTVHNNGAHLIVEGNECFIDFWPGTGKWISRNGKQGFGVRNLVKYIEAAEA